MLLIGKLSNLFQIDKFSDDAVLFQLWETSIYLLFASSAR